MKHILTVFLLAVIPMTVFAQDSVTCESRENRRQSCAIHGNTQNATVFLAEQLSDSDCTRGSTWGLDSRGIWVDRGCRARFQVSYRQGNNHGQQQAQQLAGCPAGSQVGRCTQKQRKRGCKDWRAPNGQGCYSFR